jgi:hypothetical protein
MIYLHFIRWSAEKLQKVATVSFVRKKGSQLKVKDEMDD